MESTKRRKKSSNIKKGFVATQENIEKVIKDIKESLEEKEFEIEVRVNEKVLKCNTQNIEDALKQLGGDLGRIKTKMLIFVKRGKMERDYILIAPKAKRLFINDFFRRVFVNNIYRYFK